MDPIQHLGTSLKKHGAFSLCSLLLFLPHLEERQHRLTTRCCKLPHVTHMEQWKSVTTSSSQLQPREPLAKVHQASLKQRSCAKSRALPADAGRCAWAQTAIARKAISPHISSSEPSTQSGKESHCCFRRMHWPPAHRN